MRSLIVDFELSDREKMRRFWGKGSAGAANGERIELSFRQGT